jgi:hypothetical protein
MQNDKDIPLQSWTGPEDSSVTPNCCPGLAASPGYDDDDDDDLHWVRDLKAPMHLGLINGPFVPHGRITGASGSKEESTYTCLSEAKASYSQKNVSRGFLFYSTPPTQRVV